MFDNYNTLGFRTYYKNNLSTKICKSFEEANADVSGTNLIDAAAVLAILKKNYPLGDRTLIESIKKVPWMAKPDNSGWSYSELPSHGRVNLSEDVIGSRLIQLLEREALSFISDKKVVGILLSGGMDSRIVAGILNKLKSENRYSGDIVAISWGHNDSRDIVYSRRIAARFGWDFISLPVTPEVLFDNIDLAATMGAEFSPVHLHAMYSVSKIKGLDGILAGSYGDSIGRGEYSGVKVSQLPDLMSKDFNHFSFMLKAAQKKVINDLHKDIKSLRNRYPGRSEFSYREIEQQAHYMRRQLNACMSIIDDSTPLYQMFTSPDVFGFVWSLDPVCRNDDIYESILDIIPGNLLDIPWARTGKRYNSDGSKAEDSFSSSYHRYGDWLRNDLREYVVTNIRSGALQRLGLFNESSLNKWCNLWSRSNSSKADRLDEKMAWLASMSIFLERYRVASEVNFEHQFLDTLSEVKSRLHTFAYHSYLRIKER